MVPEAYFFVPVDGGQLPSVFRSEIRNLGPQAETVFLDFTNVPPGFQAMAAVNQVTIPAGERAIIGFHLQPTAPLPLPGTVLDLDVTAHNAGSAPTETHHVALTMPEVHGVHMQSDPAELTTTPGFPIQTVLVLESRETWPKWWT